jgi:hypothetical protein
VTDDSGTCSDIIEFMGCVILTATFKLLKHDLFKPSDESEVKNIGLIISYYLEFAQNWEDIGCAEDETDWTEVLVSFADMYKVKIVGSEAVMKYVEEIREKIAGNEFKGDAACKRWVRQQQKEYNWRAHVSFFRSKSEVHT